MVVQSEAGCCDGNRPSEKGQSALQQCVNSVPRVSHQPSRDTSCRLVLEERGREDIHEACTLSLLKKHKTLQPVSCDMQLPISSQVLCEGARETGHRMVCLPMSVSRNKADLIKATHLGREKTLEMLDEIESDCS